MRSFQYRLAPEPALLADLRHALADWLREAEISERVWSSIVLATHEAAANAIEHAGSSGAVQVDARLAEGSVTVEISDHGRWKPQVRRSEDRGRGLELIQALVSETSIQRQPRGTTLRLLCRI